MSTDIPHLNKNEIRGLFYVNDINQELEQDKPPSITQLAENSEWRSSYFTNLWKKLAPELVKRVEDGQNTRLELTEHGRESVRLYKELNIVFSEAGI